MLSTSWAWKESKPLENFHQMPSPCLMTTRWTAAPSWPPPCWSASPGLRANRRPRWRLTWEWPVEVRNRGFLTSPGPLSAIPAVGTSTKASADLHTTTQSWKGRCRAALRRRTTTRWSYIPPRLCKVRHTAWLLEPHAYLYPQKTSFCQYYTYINLHLYLSTGAGCFLWFLIVLFLLTNKNVTPERVIVTSEECYEILTLLDKCVLGTLAKPRDWLAPTPKTSGRRPLGESGDTPMNWSGDAPGPHRASHRSPTARRQLAWPVSPGSSSRQTRGEKQREKGWERKQERAGERICTAPSGKGRGLSAVPRQWLPEPWPNLFLIWEPGSGQDRGMRGHFLGSGRLGKDKQFLELQIKFKTLAMGLALCPFP